MNFARFRYADLQSSEPYRVFVDPSKDYPFAGEFAQVLEAARIIYFETLSLI